MEDRKWNSGGTRGHFIARGESIFADCPVDNEFIYLF
jgi:hypothetical protein